jgi:hypothetical protein
MPSKNDGRLDSTVSRLWSKVGDTYVYSCSDCCRGKSVGMSLRGGWDAQGLAEQSVQNEMECQGSESGKRDRQVLCSSRRMLTTSK